MDGSRIKDITAAGLTYLNEQDEEVFIDFADCFQRWLGWHRTPEALKTFKEINHKTDEQAHEFIEKLAAHKAVGGRNFDGFPDLDHPFVDFYTEPPTRFEFQSRPEFDKIIYLMRKTGWRTEDLT